MLLQHTLRNITKTNINKLQYIQFYVGWKQGKTGLPIDRVDCCNSVGEGVAMTIGWVCTCEVGDTVDVKSISPS